MNEDINNSLNNSNGFSNIQPLTGSWIGTYYYSALTTPHKMQMNLSFFGGLVMGFGSDDVNEFSIGGRYAGTVIDFVKAYPSHTVAYHGQIINPRRIRGIWKINPSCTGSFNLWFKSEKSKSKAEVNKLALQLKQREVGILKKSKTPDLRSTKPWKRN